VYSGKNSGLVDIIDLHFSTAKLTVAVSGGQWRSVAVSGGQWRSVAVSGGQWRSVAVSGVLPERPSEIRFGNCMYVTSQILV
jgi:hypothetical protein